MTMASTTESTVEITQLLLEARHKKVATSFGGMAPLVKEFNGPTLFF